MTSNFDNSEYSRDNASSSPNSPVNTGLDNLKRDRFELLSAYLDGEVTAKERRYVETLLANDAITKHQYHRLLKLREAMLTMPIPASERSVEETIARVYRKADRRPLLTFTMVGATAAVLATILFPGNPLRVQFANFLKETPQNPVESVTPEPNSEAPTLEESIEDKEMDRTELGNAVSKGAGDFQQPEPAAEADGLGIRINAPVIDIPAASEESTAE